MNKCFDVVTFRGIDKMEIKEINPDGWGHTDASWQKDIWHDIAMVYWRFLDGGHEASSLHSGIVPVFLNYRNACCLSNVMFIFDRYHHNLASVWLIGFNR